MSIEQEIINLHKELPSTTKLVAVSKFNPPEAIERAYSAGQRIFAESRPQELFEKIKILPPDIKWHFIGHLQTNKIKFVVKYVDLIHSIDSKKLLLEVNKYSLNNNLKTNILLEMHIAKEESKQGFSKEEIYQIIEDYIKNPLQGVEICGLMGMASFVNDETQISKEFELIKNVFDDIKCRFSEELKSFKELSIGMSGDYKIALDHGSTMVRIGTRIFGERHY